MKHIKTKRRDGVAVLRIVGDLTGGDETDELRQVLDDLEREKDPCLVINLRFVEFITTPGLSALLGAHLKYEKRGATVRLCHVDDRVNSVFVITKLSLLFDVHETEEQAVAACLESEKQKRHRS